MVNKTKIFYTVMAFFFIGGLAGGFSFQFTHDCPVHVFKSDGQDPMWPNENSTFEPAVFEISAIEPEYELHDVDATFWNDDEYAEFEWHTCGECGTAYIQVVRNGIPVRIMEDEMSDKNITNQTCPECGKSHYQVGSTVSTMMGFSPVYKNGVNINPDKNTRTSTLICQECGHVWEVTEGGNDEQ